MPQQPPTGPVSYTTTPERKHEPAANEVAIRRPATFFCGNCGSFDVVANSITDCGCNNCSAVNLMKVYDPYAGSRIDTKLRYSRFAWCNSFGWQKFAKDVSDAAPTPPNPPAGVPIGSVCLVQEMSAGDTADDWRVYYHPAGDAYLLTDSPPATAYAPPNSPAIRRLDDQALPGRTSLPGSPYNGPNAAKGFGDFTDLDETPGPEASERDPETEAGW